MEQRPQNSPATEAGEERETLLEMRQYLRENFGIYYKDDKLHSLRKKLNRRIRCLPSITDFESYKSYLEDNSDEVQYFLDEVSTNKTAFFRESKHWDFMVEELIPRWQQSDTTIKAWSAACSTGEEPYTLAMLLDDHLKRRTRGPATDFKILATDISREALGRTKKGEYTAESIQPVTDYNPRYTQNYFDSDEDQFTVKDKLVETLTLRYFNLKERSYPFNTTFDLIVCRNVMIYFDEELTERIVTQLTKALKPDGYLFVGHTETLRDFNHRLEKIQPAVFRKV